nr:MAG TPA: hypothetical protein [Caudoviricetes sp.]
MTKPRYVLQQKVLGLILAWLQCSQQVTVNAMDCHHLSN